jgi:hypothetical protein
MSELKTARHHLVVVVVFLLLFPTLPSQAGQAERLCRSMVFRHLHVKAGARVSEVLCRQDGAFLTDKKGGLQREKEGGYVSAHLETDWGGILHEKYLH